jgi:hypothetical protein
VKSFAVEGTSFWLVVSAILLGASAYGSEATLAAAALGIAVVYAVAAYFAWNGAKWAFAFAVALAVFTLIANVFFGVLRAVINLSVYGTVEGLTDSGFAILSPIAWLMIPQFLLIFYSWRAYRELAAA